MFHISIPAFSTNPKSRLRVTRRNHERMMMEISYKYYIISKSTENQFEYLGIPATAGGNDRRNILKDVRSLSASGHR